MILGLSEIVVAFVSIQSIKLDWKISIIEIKPAPSAATIIANATAFLRAATSAVCISSNLVKQHYVTPILESTAVGLRGTIRSA